MTAETPLARNLRALQTRALAVGVVGAVAALVGLVVDADRFYQAHLTAWLFWLGPGLGSLGVVMLHNLTGGAWGFAIRRLLEAAMRTLPLLALLFLPVILGIHHLYEWSHDDVVAADPVLRQKTAYLNEPFFVLRGVAFFALWIAFARAEIRASERYDRTFSPRVLRRAKLLSGLGLVVYVLTMSFASFDWGMSLEPHWFSTIYGAHIVVGQVLTTLCVAILAASRLARYEPFSRWIQTSHFHDLGNLLLAFVMLWAYMGFSQFLIIWSGNVPEETPWYLHRTGHGWQAIALLLIVVHFAVPFFLLLMRRVKKERKALAGLAAVLLLMRFLDYYWYVAPAFQHAEPAPSWIDLAGLLAVGGLWIALFVRNLRGRPLVSLQDARLLRELEEAPSAP